MIAVIFKAEVAKVDDEYFKTAARMRELAFKDYGCIDFISVTEGSQEVSISYWPSMEHAQKWHANPEHQAAQKLGKQKWYKSWKVEITEVKRNYGS